MKLSTKLLLLLMLCLITVAGRCGGGGGTGGGTCSRICYAGYEYQVIYHDGCSFSRFYQCYTGGYSGVISFPADCNGTCNVSFIEWRRFGYSLSAAPSGANLNAPPSSVTITGQAMDATYGMPTVEYFDPNGYLIGAVAATSVSADGTSLVAPVPDLSGAYSGTFQVQVTNKTSAGYYQDIVGSATLNCWGRDRTDSDSDGWYDDEDCYPYDSSRVNCFDPGGGCNGDESGPYHHQYEICPMY